MVSIDKHSKRRRHTLRIAAAVTVAFALISSARALYRALNPRDATDIHFIVDAKLKDLQPLCDRIPLDACVHYDPPPADADVPFPHPYIAQHALAPRLLSRDNDCAWRLSYRALEATDGSADPFVTIARSERGILLQRRAATAEAPHD